MEGKRPGGLTALAIINFIMAAWACCGGFSTFVAGGLLGAMSSSPEMTKEMSEQEKADLREAQELLNDPRIKVFGAISLLVCALLIASGVGYLQQKRVLGRMVGNIYAIIEIVQVVTAAILFSDVAGHVTIMTAIELVYPIVTLALLNTIFRHDFHR